MRLNLPLLLLWLALLAGCAKHEELLIGAGVSTSDEPSAGIEKLSREQRQHVAAYLARFKLAQALGNQSVAAGSLREAIEDQIRWESAEVAGRVREATLQ